MAIMVRGLPVTALGMEEQDGTLLTMGYPVQPFQDKKLKSPHRATNLQQTDTVLYRLTGTRLPDEPKKIPVFVNPYRDFLRPSKNMFASALMSFLHILDLLHQISAVRSQDALVGRVAGIAPESIFTVLCKTPEEAVGRPVSLR